MIERFERDDGLVLRAVPGFRQAVLKGRPSSTPKEHWDQADYARIAARRVAAARRRWQETGAALAGTPARRGLEIGCGAGVDCVLGALEGLDVTGVDVDSPLLDGEGRRARALRLLGAVAALAGRPEDPELLLRRLAVQIAPMDACALTLESGSIDVVWSRTALEHVRPLERALAETARVLRPGGVAHHVIDPFCWVKGCHARGLTDLPWAHARLTPDEYHRFVAAAETRGRADRRAAWMASLNALTVRGWRETIERSGAFAVVDWREYHLPFGRELLAAHPDVPPTALPGVERRDLTCSAITAVLRRTRLGDARVTQAPGAGPSR